MSAEIKVSVLVSVYKSDKFIKGKLEDLLAQTIIQNTEVIIINSGSPQNEDAVIQEYLPRFPFSRYIKTEERETIYRAWNRGAEVANGKYITNANTDDRLAPDAFEKMSEYLDRHPDTGVIYTDQRYSYTANETLEQAKNNPVFFCPDFSPLALMDICIIGSQPMWRRDLHTQHGLYFNPELEISGDHDFYLRALLFTKFAKMPGYISGTFYKPADNSNKEAQNKSASFIEGNKVTFGNIQKLMKEPFVTDAIPLFRILVRLPFILYRLLHRANRALSEDHILNYEFVYLLAALDYYNSGKFNRAYSVARKYLRKAPSMRLEAVKTACEKKLTGEIPL